MSKQEILTQKIQELEAKIEVFSERDMVRVKELEKELKELNMELLDTMVDGNM